MPGNPGESELETGTKDSLRLYHFHCLPLPNTVANQPNFRLGLYRPCRICHT